jgi:soluble lytic murein transglycosylase-like protein
MKKRRRETRLNGLLIAVGLAILATKAVNAEAAETQASFTFRRVAPPASSAKRRITIQIELTARPSADEEPGSQGPAETDLVALEPLLPITFGPAGQDYDTFWAYLSPIKGPGRLSQASRLLQSLNAGADVRSKVSAAGIRQIGLRFGSAVTEATRGRSVSPALVLAVIMVESSGRSDAVSHAGAAGLMQLMPGTAARFKVRDRLDPRESIRGGVEYLEWLLEEFEGDAILALAGYNAGENAVRRFGGVPPYSETRAYVPKVVAAWQAASELCTAQQKTASDTCQLDAYDIAER